MSVASDFRHFHFTNHCTRGPNNANTESVTVAEFIRVMKVAKWCGGDVFSITLQLRLYV